MQAPLWSKVIIQMFLLLSKKVAKACENCLQQEGSQRNDLKQRGKPFSLKLSRAGIVGFKVYAQHMMI